MQIVTKGIGLNGSGVSEGVSAGWEPCVAKRCDMGDSTTKQFDTGAVRSSDADAVRYDLVSPIGLRRLAKTCHEGAEKYTPFNWEQGMPVGDLLNHAVRHVYLFLEGDRSEDHLGHAAWNLFGAMHSEELWPDLNKGRLRGPGCSAPVETAAQGGGC